MPSKIKRRLALKDACLLHYTSEDAPEMNSEESVIIESTKTLVRLAPEVSHPKDPTLPHKPGLYRYRSEETKYKWATVAICRFRIGRALRVHGQPFGEASLVELHKSQTNIEWEHLA
jgi:hypothetical protein